MADTPQATAQLEELVDAYVDGARDLDEGPSVSLDELEQALAARIELAGGPDVDVDKLVRSGAALRRLRLFAGTDVLRGVVEGDEELEVMAAGAMRDELARDLTYAIHAAGEWRDVEVLERAHAIRDLTEAYVRLGGELGRLLPTREAMPPIVDNDELLARIWRRLNEWTEPDRIPLSTADVDRIVAIVREELEAPVTEEREHAGTGEASA